MPKPMNTETVKATSTATRLSVMFVVAVGVMALLLAAIAWAAKTFNW